MLSLNIQNATEIEFGRLSRHDANPATGEYCEVFKLTGKTDRGDRFAVDVFCAGGTVTPTINTEITDIQGKVIGDWLTDSIDGISLELPPMPEETPTNEPEQSDAYRLMSALATASNLVGKHSDRLSKEKAAIVLAGFNTAFELAKDVG